MGWKVDLVKPVSSRRRYEVLNAMGVWVDVEGDGRMRKLSGPALDRWIDERIYKEAHPGKPMNRKGGNTVICGTCHESSCGCPTP